MVMQEFKRGMEHSKNGIENKKKHEMPLMSGDHRISQPSTEYGQTIIIDPNKTLGMMKS